MELTVKQLETMSPQEQLREVFCWGLQMECRAEDAERKLQHRYSLFVTQKISTMIEKKRPQCPRKGPSSQPPIR